MFFYFMDFIFLVNFKLLTLSIIAKTSWAAALAVANVPKNGVALPKLNTAIIMLKKTNKIFPTVYSSVVVSVHPYLLKIKRKKLIRSILLEFSQSLKIKYYCINYQKPRA